jgi:glycosyltransferase involved in cell wall biosynthesis
MKITYLSSPISSQYGGGEKFLDDFTTGINAEHQFIGSSKAVHDLFQSKGFKSTLTSGLFEPVSPRNLILVPVSIVVGLCQFMRFYKTFKSADWIVSPTSNCETFFVIPWLKLILRKQVLFMVHNGNVPKIFRVKPFGWLLSKCWGKSPVVFVSHSQQETWSKAGCASINQIVIYNGVKVDKLKLVEKRENIITLGFIGRLNREKGCDTLINSIPLITCKQNIEIVIAGEGDQKQELVDLLDTVPVPDNIKVRFAGFQNDTKSFYESIDLLVFPSRRESFGLVICEAMERGVSVLCSNIPSSLEIKQILGLQFENELIVESENTVALAQKIDYFIEKKEDYLTFEYKKKLHESIAKTLSLEKMIYEYKKVLNV